MRSLPKRFYLNSTTSVAKSLLGKGLLVENRLLAEIVEVEAYLGKKDPASHSARGPTPRNQPMFEQGGICYVYLSYGINYCMNVVTGPEGLGEAVLIRAIRPLRGTNAMARSRGLAPFTGDLDNPLKSIANICNGPGKLTQALGIDLRYNGLQFGRTGLKLVDLGKTYTASQIGRSPRIGISQATDKLLRFYVKGSPWLSRNEKQKD